MHEIGLCEALLDAVERRAAGRRVARVTFRVGVLHRVVEPSLAQAFELVSGGTVAEGAEVELVTVPVTARCARCEAVTTSTDEVAMCPQCGATALTITGGDELILESIQLASPGLRRERTMCLGIPGEIVELLDDQPDLAKVAVSGVRRAINIGLLDGESLVPGDWVLIHVGFAMSKIDEGEARAAMEFLEGIGVAYEEEIAALLASRIEEDGR